ncbi:hypothetical protein [Arthrobacter alpinus]|uniref:hypothetical protein n=1 Tax=Arthrobacter alpinus TaxID=656366 RepID=UPI000943211F|nr:hypothetical protein [Arthrobacter alpinus]
MLTVTGLGKPQHRIFHFLAKRLLIIGVAQGRAAQLGHKALFAAATDQVTRLGTAHQNGQLPQELAKFRSYWLIIVDEVSAPGSSG